MKQLKQFVYYKNPGNNKVTNPEISLNNNPWESNLFSNYRVSHLGIQGNKNIRFSLNGSNNAIMIGSTGIYEIDLGNNGYIYSLKFYDLDDTVTDRLIVDFIYEDMEG